MINNRGYFSSTQLTSTGNIACCGEDGNISIFNIETKFPKLIETINILDRKMIYRIKEITNSRLISNQDEKSLIFYEYNKKNLKITNKIRMENYIENLLPTKNNDILLYANFFCPRYHFKILLFDAENLKITKKILSCNGNSEIYEPFSFLTKNIIAIVINTSLFLVDMNQDYSVISKIEGQNSKWINGICCFNSKKIVTGDKSGKIILWDYENNILNKKYEYQLEKVSNLNLSCLMKLRNNLFLVGGEYRFINVFNFYKKNEEKTNKKK